MVYCLSFVFLGSNTVRWYPGASKNCNSVRFVTVMKKYH